VKNWYLGDRGKRAVEALKKRGLRPFTWRIRPRPKMVLKEIPAGAGGVGGSVTIRGLKVIEELRARGTRS
jgi:hypothetical protein